MFNDLETSVDGGRPIYLYRFNLDPSTWRYTSADEDIVAGGFTWVAVPISDGGINQTGEAAQDSLQIMTDPTIEAVQAFRGCPPTNSMQVAILRTHEGDPDGQVITAYVGEVSSMNQDGPNTVTITCETLSATMRRTGVRLMWQRSCPYALYDPLTCKVNKALHAVAGTVTAVVGNALVVPAYAGLPVDRLAGGFIEWTDPVRGLERRAIESSPGAPYAGYVYLMGTVEGILVGTAVTAYPGCARTLAACDGFSNRANYGGFPHMPGFTPFGESTVF